MQQSSASSLKGFSCNDDLSLIYKLGNQRLMGGCLTAGTITNYKKEVGGCSVSFPV